VLSALDDNRVEGVVAPPVAPPVELEMLWAAGLDPARFRAT
jgi:hypothetical protein